MIGFGSIGFRQALIHLGREAIMAAGCPMAECKTPISGTVGLYRGEVQKLKPQVCVEKAR